VCLVEPRAEREQDGRAEKGQRRARFLAEPAALHRESDQEDEADDHGDAPHEGEQTAAEQLLEVELAPRLRSGN